MNLTIILINYFCLGGGILISIVVFIIGVVGGIIFSSGLNLFQANVLIDKKHKTTNEPSVTFDI